MAELNSPYSFPEFQDSLTTIKDLVVDADAIDMDDMDAYDTAWSKVFNACQRLSDIYNDESNLVWQWFMDLSDDEFELYRQLIDIYNGEYV